MRATTASTVSSTRKRFGLITPRGLAISANRKAKMSEPWVTIWPIVVGMGIRVGRLRERENIREQGRPHRKWAAQQGLRAGWRQPPHGSRAVRACSSNLGHLLFWRSAAGNERGRREVSPTQQRPPTPFDRDSVTTSGGGDLERARDALSRDQAEKAIRVPESDHS